ncbi:hypothetical protein GCM10027406_28540 [Leifsonia lichenia]
MRRGSAIVAGIAVVALSVVGSAVPAEASPQQLARERAAATLAEVRKAAEPRPELLDEAAQVATEAPDATIDLSPGTKATVASEKLGASATFSGHEVDHELSVSIAQAPEAASRVARAETAGVVVSKVVQVDAVTSDGAAVTSFPAKRTKTRGGDDGSPAVSDVVPGVALELSVDQSTVKKSELDPASLAIYTREKPGEAWTRIPSYYDAKTKTVKGESDHLSQFVVIGVPFTAPPGPSIVLDPDDDEGHSNSPATVSELPYNMALTNGLAALFQQQCLANVTITRTGDMPYVSRQTRAGIAAAANPALTLGIGFNTWLGHAWGSDGSDGGSQLYSRGGPLDEAVTASLIAELPAYTGRPAKQMPASADFPHPEFGWVPGAMTHLEALFLDHNFDWSVIANGFQSVVNGAFTGSGKYLESQGFDCTDPATGGWPAKPSAADLSRWRDLGHQNYLTYGAEPISFSTGNLIEDFSLFTLPGLGSQELDLTLTYNSQDGRLSRVGAGWSFGLGARAQRFSDGSVLVVRGDGASYVFAPDGAGGYLAEPGLRQTLAEAGDGNLRLTAVDGETWMFAAGDIEGIGELVSHTDRRGNTITLQYGAADPASQSFVPLVSVTDEAGQTIAVENDGDGRIVAMTLPDGRRWGFGYDAAGDLVTIGYPDARTRTFTYDDRHQLLTATDPLGVTYLSNSYDAAGRVVKQIDPDGNVRLLDYSVAGQTSYTDNEGRVSVFHFDDRRRITKIVDASGAEVAYAFDDEYQVTKHVDENGGVTTYGYDERGNVTSVSHPDGSVVKYTYTPLGDLASRTDAGGAKGAERTVAYDRNAAGLVTVEHRPDGTAVATRYDDAGDPIAVVQPSGATTTYEYDLRGNAVAVTDADGNTTRYGYDLSNRVVSATDPRGGVTAYGWDAGGRLAAVTDALGGVTRYEYDGNDHLVSATDASGAVTAYAWNAMFDLVRVTAPDGGVTTYEYNTENALTRSTDPTGSVTEYRRDALDRLTQTVDPNGGVWATEYDSAGNATSGSDPLGATSTTAFDAMGRVTSTKGPTGAARTIVYDAVGRATSEKDASGAVTAYEYDLLDRVVVVTDPLGKRTRLVYDEDGNLTGTFDRLGNATAFAYTPAGVLTSMTDSAGGTTTFETDAGGNVTAVSDALGRTSRFAYDAIGRAVSATDPTGATTATTYDALGRAVSATDALGNMSTTAYDRAGRVVSVTDPVGAVTGYGYDKAGRQTSMTDGNGNVTRYAYDPAGQLLEVIEGFTKEAKKASAGVSDVNVTTSYGYDAVGNLTSITDPNGNATTFTFDPAGLTLSETNAAGNRWQYNYDKAGRLTAQKDANGATTRFEYTDRGDLSRIRYPAATVGYEYDAEQHLIAMTDPTGVTGWTYDTTGRMTKQIDGNGTRVSYEYDAVGSLNGLTLPTGEVVGYRYDDASRVIEQTSPWGGIAYEWDAASNLVKQTRSTGVTSAFEYDAASRVTGIVHGTPAPAEPPATDPAKPSMLPEVKRGAQQCSNGATQYLSGRTVPAAIDCIKTGEYLADRSVPTAPNPVADGGALRFEYGYDKAGNVSSASRTVGSGSPVSRDFTYDALNRLTGSTASTGEKNTYRYDAVGNRTGWDRTGSSADFAATATFNEVNQLTETSRTGAEGAQDASYSYDRAGNRTGQVVGGARTSFDYDPSGRVTSVSRDGRATSYAYDGLGRQVSSTDTTDRGGSQTTTQAWSGTSVVQRSNSAHGVTSLVRDAAGELALQASGSSEVAWALVDRLGSTAAQSVGGSITQLADYADFGEASFETSGWSSPLGFTGETVDAGYGLNQYFARTYDPASGSWLSQDPYRGLLTQPQTLHRYAYVGSNPVTFWDLLGFRAAPFNGTDSIPLGTGMTKQQMADAMSGPLGTQVTPVSLRDGLTVNDPKHKSVQWEKPRHVDGKPASAISYGDSVAKHWEDTWANAGKHWDETWANFFNNDTSRRWADVWRWIDEQLNGSFQGSFCAAFLCGVGGNGSVGIGVGIGAGGSAMVGATHGDTEGLGVTLSCTGSLAGIGIYAEYSRDIFGRQSMGTGVANGIQASCSAAIVWMW